MAVVDGGGGIRTFYRVSIARSRYRPRTFRRTTWQFRGLVLSTLGAVDLLVLQPCKIHEQECVS